MTYEDEITGVMMDFENDISLYSDPSSETIQF